MKLNKAQKVLITGAGAPGGPGIIRCMQAVENIEVCIADANEFATGKAFCNEFYLIPKATDKNFAETVLQVCIANRVTMILPLVTRELYIFSEHKRLFEEQGIHIVVCDFEILEKVNNKRKLLQHIQAKGIACANFRVVNTLNQFYSGCAELGYPNQAICIKPSDGNGSRGVRIIDDSKNLFDLWLNEKPNNLFIRFEQMEEILKMGEFPELLLMENLPGEEYTIDAIVGKHKIELILPRKRTKMSGGISVAGVFENNKMIIEYCRQILSSLAVIGPIGLQVKEDKMGHFKLIEINPRLQGTSVAAMGMGINLPYLAIKAYLGEEIESHEVDSIWGTRFARYYNETYF